jgi:hypothetical protein
LNNALPNNDLAGSSAMALKPRLLCALLACLAVNSAFGGDSGTPAPNPKPESKNEPPAEAVTVTDDNSPQPREPARPQIRDPLFSINSKLKGSDSTTNADVVELGSGPLDLPAGDGKWALPDEEKAAPGLTRGDNRPRPGDPEFARHFPAESETDTDVPEARATKMRPFRPSLGDPESRFRNLPGGVAEADVINTLTGGSSRFASQRQDAPRFPAGVGLDSDAAEAVADMADAAQKPEDPNGAEKTESEAARKAAVDKLRLAMNQRKAASRNGKKPKEEDLEKVFQQTIEQVERERPLVEEELKKAREDREKKIAQFADLHIRDENAALVLDALVNKTPLGTVSCRVTDRTTKLPVCARVRLTDITDVPIAAPLPQGFWTAGDFSAQAISGVAKIELSRGRFNPSYVQRIRVQPTVPSVVDAQVDQVKIYDFPSRGWYVADFDSGLRVRQGEKPAWLGARPTLADLTTVARAEGIHILGVPPPWGDGPDAENPALLDKFQSDDLFLLPVLPGPRHAFHGIGCGLGVSSVQDFSLEVTAPEVPLREGFEEIRSRGGLAVYKQLRGLRNADIRREILPLFPRLEELQFFGKNEGSVPLFAANELPFDTVTGSYDLLAFDGSPEAERLWFNLLGHGYPVSIIGAGGGSLEGGHIPSGQTLVQLPGKPTRESVLAAVKQGHTVISFGPAVFPRIAERDMGPGCVLPADGRTLSLQIQAYASMIPGTELSKIEVIRNGEVIRTHEPNAGETLIHSLSWSINEVTAAWYVIRVTERYTKDTPLASGAKTATAWSSPIFFRGPSFSPPAPAVSRISGVLQIGATPCAGRIKAVVVGQPDRQIETDANGRYKIDISAAGTLIFEAPNAEPRALRVFEHPKVQRALGHLQSSGMTAEQFEKPSLFPAWNLLLSELEWDVSLVPAKTSKRLIPAKEMPPAHEAKSETEIIQPQR